MVIYLQMKEICKNNKLAFYFIPVETNFVYIYF